MAQKTPNEVYFRMQRAFATHGRATRNLVTLADPRTGGNVTMARNWGNPEANAVIDRMSAQWRIYDAAYRAAYKQATHQEHIDEAGRYLWCDHCAPVRRAREFIAA